jgi:nucleotide-binding universal stress UspA family protein
MSGQEHRASPRIVAGVDGSPSSMCALRWAIRQAGLTGAVVDAVIAWHYPVADGGFGWVPTGIGEGFDFKENAEKTLADAISSAADPGSATVVRALVVEGNPAQVLLAASDGADLLVVGSRGHGARSRKLPGTVKPVTQTDHEPARTASVRILTVPSGRRL